MEGSLRQFDRVKQYTREIRGGIIEANKTSTYEQVQVMKKFVGC